jgi:hypothetical protein
MRRTFIRCTKSEFSAVTRQSREKVGTEHGEWTYIGIPSSHVPMADMPGRLHRILLTGAYR